MPGVRYRYLLGAMQQIAVSTIVRAQCIAEEQARIPELIDRWRRSSARMQELSRTQAGAADAVPLVDPPQEISEPIRLIAEGIFRKQAARDPRSSHARHRFCRAAEPRSEASRLGLEGPSGKDL